METVTVNVNGVHGTSSRGGDDGGNITHSITQGELLRQEQEAGIVPVPAAIPNGRVTRSSAAASAAATRAVGGGGGGDLMDDIADPEEEMETEPVHARGPDVIGMEDTGPQTPGSGLAGGIDLAGALGRRGEGETMAATVGMVVAQEQGQKQEREQEREQRSEEKDGNTDSDGDSTVAHTDGVRGDHDEGVDLSGDNRGPDAVDDTAL